MSLPCQVSWRRRSPVCDNACPTPGASPSACRAPLGTGQMGTSPTGSVRTLQNEQSPQPAPELGGAARLQEAPGAGCGAGAALGPEVTWPHRCTRVRTHPVAQPRPLCFPAEDPSTRVGSRGGLPTAGPLGVHRCPRLTSKCTNRARLRGGERDRDGARRGPGVPPADWGLSVVRGFLLSQGSETLRGRPIGGKRARFKG